MAAHVFTEREAREKWCVTVQRLCAGSACMGWVRVEGGGDLGRCGMVPEHSRKERGVEKKVGQRGAVLGRLVG